MYRMYAVAPSIDQLNQDKWAYAAAVNIDTHIDGFFSILNSK